jgi:hypothetical protein
VEADRKEGDVMIQLFRRRSTDRVGWGILGLVSLPLALYASGQATSSAVVTPTFTKDVAPILFAKCTECHRRGEIAPMSLLSYEEVRPWAKAIRVKILSREMPPWHADQRFGKFRNDRSLTQSEIDTIVTWIDNGAPRGDARDVPIPPHFASGWQDQRDPDFVFEMPVVEVPAEGQLPNEYYWVPNPFAEDKFVEALELRPGNRAVVHHIRVDAVELPQGCKVVGAKLKALDGGFCKEPGGANDIVTTQGDRFYLVAWVPGRGLERKPTGTAKRVSGNHWIRFNMHYQPNGKMTTDQTKLGIWFAEGHISHEIFTRTAGQSLPTDPDVTRLIAQGNEIVRTRSEGRGGNNGAGRLPNIPPYADNWELIGITPITEPITLYSLSPHMHLRGKDLKWIVTWPDGRDETLLSVPKYDFNWQMQYELAVPLKLPAGSKITAIAHFDNTANNKYNPNPDKEVYWAEQSWDEMFSPFIEYTVDSLTVDKLPSASSRQQ